MMKIGGIEYSTTEMTNTLLELWSCEFTIEGLQTNCSMRAVVQGHIPQFQPLYIGSYSCCDSCTAVILGFCNAVTLAVHARRGLMSAIVIAQFTYAPHEVKS